MIGLRTCKQLDLSQSRGLDRHLRGKNKKRVEDFKSKSFLCAMCERMSVEKKKV